MQRDTLVSFEGVVKRFGSFVALYGLKNTIDMIDGALARSA